MKRQWALGMTAAAAMASAVCAQDDFSNAVTETHDLGHGVYVLETTGASRTVGNITFAVGEDGIIMVDAGFQAIHDQLYDAIRAVSDKPIRYLVNTHHHPDHADGNVLWGEKGVAIVGHVNMRPPLEEGMDSPRGPIAPAPWPALPQITYTDEMTLYVKGQSVILRYPGFAHSGGDSVVYFPSANVLTTGDIYATGRYPRIDTASGGGIDDMIRTVDLFIEMSDDDTIVVPGHGPFARKADVVAYRAMLAEVRDHVAALKAQGKSLQDIKDENAMAEFDAVWSPSDEVADQFLGAVYETVG